MGSSYIAQVNAECGQNTDQYVYFYIQAIAYFSKAVQCGQRSKPQKWIKDMYTSYKECVDDALKPVVDVSVNVRIGFIESYAQVIADDKYRPDCYRHMGTILFHHAVKALETGDYEASLYALKECYRPIEEMKGWSKGHRDIQAEVKVLEADVEMHTASAESMRAVVIGK